MSLITYKLLFSPILFCLPQYYSNYVLISLYYHSYFQMGKTIIADSDRWAIPRSRSTFDLNEDEDKKKGCEYYNISHFR